MRRLAEPDAYGAAASALDCANSGESRFPTGVARLMRLKMFRAATLNVRL